MIKVLFINSIFPNAVEPNKGNFVHKNIAAYPDDVEVKVIAPVPFFLSSWRRKKTTKLPKQEVMIISSKQVTVLRPRFILIPRNILQAFIPLLEYLLIRRSVNLLIKTWKPDIIHANFGMPDGIAAALISREIGIPLVITEHQGKLRSFLSKRFIGWQLLRAYDKASRVICVSTYSANVIVEFSPSQNNIAVVPNGVDFDRFSLRELRATPHKAIFVGNLVPLKGVHVLLNALAKLKTKGVTIELSIIGDGIQRKNLESLSQSLGLNSQVTFMGEKKAIEVAELMCKHDFMIHPSFIESFGIVMVEALAAGLPVVSTFNGGAEDIITNEVGILVKADDVNELVAGIMMLFNRWHDFDPSSIRRYGLNLFSMESVATRTINVYRECIHA